MKAREAFEQILNRKNHIEEFYAKFISEVN